MKNEHGYLDSYRKLIQCPTVTESGHEYFQAFHDVLDKEFPNVTATLEKIELGRDVLLYKWKGLSSEKPVVLMAHQDVVPADDGDWICDPYSATVKDGKVYGRGTMDCKVTLFSTIQAVEELIAEGFVPKYDVYLSYSDCEENAGPGAEMARDYFKSHGIRINVVIDEGGAIMRKFFPKMVKDACMVGIIEKGYADVKFIARGKGGHSSQPPKNTPIARLGALINYCETHTVFKPRKSKAATAMIKGLGNVLSSPLKGLAKAFGGTSLVAHLAPKVNASYGRPMFETTMVFTMCGGATAPNIIPQEAWVNANLRFAQDDDKDKCIKKLEKIAKKFDVEMEVHKARNASPMVDISSDAYKTFADAVKSTYPDVEVVPYYMFGGTDCRTMQEISNTAIRCTPCKLTMEQLGGMHAANENIDIDAIDGTVACFKTFLKNYKG